MKNYIFLERLQLVTHIGVTDEERATTQTILADITLQPTRPFAATGDDLSKTVDYSVVSTLALQIATSQSRHLLEHLAQDLATTFLQKFPIQKIKITLRKKLLPHCDFSGVSLTLKNP